MARSRCADARNWRAYRKTRKAIRNSGITALSLESAGGAAMFSQISPLREESKMRSTIRYANCQAVLAISLFLFPVVARAQHYKQTNLVSNIAGMAPVTDPNLKNPC